MTPKVDFDRRAHNGQPNWPEAALELVKRECALGTSSGQIVKKLKAQLGISKTRNAVIGKVIRMGYSRPVTGKASAPARLKPSVPRIVTRSRQPIAAPAMISTPADVNAFKISGGGHIVKPAPSVPMKPVAAPAVYQPPVTLLDLEAGQCRMVVSAEDAPEPLFCGCRCERSGRGRFQSYCAPHMRVTLAKTPAKPRAADAPIFSVRRFVSHKIGSRFNGF